MPDTAPIAAALFAAALALSVQAGAAEPSQAEPSTTFDKAHGSAHDGFLQIQLVDGSVLAVMTDENIRSGAQAGKRTQLPLRAGTEPGQQVPQVLMRRRGQIFDPATPGVVASIRG